MVSICGACLHIVADLRSLVRAIVVDWVFSYLINFRLWLKKLIVTVLGSIWVKVRILVRIIPLTPRLSFLFLLVEVSLISTVIGIRSVGILHFRTFHRSSYLISSNRGIVLSTTNLGLNIWEHTSSTCSGNSCLSLSWFGWGLPYFPLFRAARVPPFVMRLCSTMAFDFRGVIKLIVSRRISHCHRWTILDEIVVIIFSMSDFGPELVISLRLWSIFARVLDAPYSTFILSSYRWRYGPLSSEWHFQIRLGRVRVS
jgi:hypothetical protein